MNSSRYIEDLKNPIYDAVEILNRHFLTPEPYVFKLKTEEFAAFRVKMSNALTIASQMPVHPSDLVICGSAHLGFSPVMSSGFSDFNPDESDMDLAIVSGDIFHKIWKELNEIPFFDENQRDHVSDLFWGFVSPYHISGFSSMASRISRVINSTAVLPWAKVLRARVYKDHWAMQNYHLRAIRYAMASYRGQPALPAPTPTIAPAVSPTQAAPQSAPSADKAGR